MTTTAGRRAVHYRGTVYASRAACGRYLRLDGTTTATDDNTAVTCRACLTSMTPAIQAPTAPATAALEAQADALRAAAAILDTMHVWSRELNNPVCPVGFFYAIDGGDPMGPFTSEDLAVTWAMRAVLNQTGVAR